MDFSSFSTLDVIIQPVPFNIVCNLIYKDCVSKEFHRDVDYSDFKISENGELCFRELEVYGRHKGHFTLFINALEFICDLENQKDLMKLDKKYGVIDGREALYSNGNLFQQPFYNYIYQQYLYYKSR